MSSDGFRNLVETLLSEFAAANNQADPVFWVEHSPPNGQNIQATKP